MLCKNKLYRRVLVSNVGRKLIIHRKLNTYGYINFTVVSNSAHIPNSKFQYIIGPNLLSDGYERGHNYFLPAEDYKQPFQPKDQHNQRSYQMLQVNLKDHWSSYEIAKKNSDSFCSFKNVELLSTCTPPTLLDQWTGIFDGAQSLSLDPLNINSHRIASVIQLFCLENIKQVEIKFSCNYTRTGILNLLKAMPNIKVLVFQNVEHVSLSTTVQYAFVKFPNYPLRKFSLDVLDTVTLSNSKLGFYVKELLSCWGSNLELLRINKVSYENRTTLLTVDIFYEQEDVCEELKEEIKDLVEWINTNIRYYPRLKYFAYYSYQFLIDRDVEPCQWIELSGKEW
ncbi:uncharacterized protein RJT21DRAFT_122898 [Scheffersomyces amazonensis]|uniref:uncharacterized protein n=1 Tax=Scheffersomyces amazonensis TaxID=1078765 RepID=UPI00315D1B99